MGDQAFYIPAVTQHSIPDCSRRDRAILHAQDRFMLYETRRPSVRTCERRVRSCRFFAGYLRDFALLFGVIVSSAAECNQSGWSSRCWWRSELPILTSETGANSLESYFHHGCRIRSRRVAVAVFARRAGGHAGAGLSRSPFIPTTALWFRIWMGSRVLVSSAPGVFTSPLSLRLVDSRGWAVTLVLAWSQDEWILFGPSAMAARTYFSSNWHASVLLVNLG